MVSDKRIKLIIIHPSVLTSRWVTYYHIDELCKIFDVEWWNISAIAAPHYNLPAIERPYVKTFIKKRIFFQALRALPSDVLIDFDRVMFCKENYSLLRRFAHIHKQVIWFDFFSGDAISAAKYGWLPSKDNKNESSIIAREPQVVPFSKQLKHNIARVIKRKTDWFWPYVKDNIARHKKMPAPQILDMWFSICQALFDTEVICSNDMTGGRYFINGQDYEQYLSLGLPQNRKDKYIVYIDQNFPLHPETRRQYPDMIDIEERAIKFQAEMRNFFDKVEKETGYRILIASHPSSKYEPNTFGGREIILGKTAELVRDCEAVIAHTSNAINFAVFWDKPLVLCYNDLLKQCSVEYNLLKTLSEYFNISSFDISIKDTGTCIRKLSPEDRTRYMMYSTNEGNKNKSNVELYKEHLTAIYRRRYG